MVFGTSREVVQDQFDIRAVKERLERAKGRLTARQGTSRLVHQSMVEEGDVEVRERERERGGIRETGQKGRRDHSSPRPCLTRRV